ncbi:unnamed protein product [Amoebophrya sp. A25]|nr:unnamed protein product [Amoebophrya sp. A25]|eukprot:GSA25T00025186001.1
MMAAIPECQYYSTPSSCYYILSTLRMTLSRTSLRKMASTSWSSIDWNSTTAERPY